MNYIEFNSYPPSNAIFRFFLNVADNSHAGRPPGIAADLHTLKSPKMVVAAVCSLQIKQQID